MDLLLLLLIIVAVVSVSGWGYGTYTYRPGPARGDVVAPVWVNPVGVIAAIAIVGVLLMFITGWRPIIIAP